MRPAVACLLVALVGVLGGARVAQADVVQPRSAADFRDSVGVATHIAYYDTAYADWPRAVARLEELGVRHLRDGVYANPAPRWRDWNERYYRAVELAADRGMRFAFLMGRPGNDAGTLDQLLGVVDGRLRRAVDALEAPNEFDFFGGTPRWPAALETYTRELYHKAKARPSLRSVPVLAPSFMAADAPRRFGDQRASLDLGNIHPYTGGRSPDPGHVRSELARAGVVAGPKPVWATEAGFHNALAARTDHAPVSEQAAAVYLLRQYLEHFRSGIARTYAYELLDQTAEPAGRKPQQHFGLLRNDFSPKPAFVALRRLLAAVGDDEVPERSRPLRLELTGPATRDLRSLVLQRADGSHLVALWRTASVWDPERRESRAVRARRLDVGLPGGARASVLRPTLSDARALLRLRRGRARIDVGGLPLLLEVTARGRSGRLAR